MNKCDESCQLQPMLLLLYLFLAIVILIKIINFMLYAELICPHFWLTQWHSTQMGGTLNMVIYGICLNLKWFACANTFFRATAAAAAYHAGSRRICLLTLLRLLLGCLPTTTFLDENSVELFCWRMMNIPASEMKINIFILNIKVALTVALIAALLIYLREF